jgi:arylsulfatase A-like enzyme
MFRPSRRDFLKLAGLTSGAAAVARLAPGLASVRGAGDLPNIIILVFDAMTARNLSLYGYKRKTTPNIEKFAQRAIVYHRHHSGGNYTSPGAASLLTGTYPWTHRAFNIGGLIERDKVDHNIFAAFGGEYHRLAYSQNLLPNYFFGQFERNLDSVLPPSAFSLISQVTGEKFVNVLDGGYRAYDNFMFQDGAPPASLVFGLADRILLRSREARAQADDYPRGLPRAGDHALFFRLKDVFDGLQTTFDELQSPFLAYLHLWAPHSPYKPSREFDDKFLDNFRPERKPDHRLGDHTPNSNLNGRRQNYDEYIANIDAEFGRLMDDLQASGILDQSYVVVTSDHGESFERGVDGHVTKLLYETLMHVPLIISPPGGTPRLDISTPTHHVDIMPTLLHLAGRGQPDWAEGVLLPGLGGAHDPARATYTVEAKANRVYEPLTRATVAMVKDRYKLIYYTGYESEDSFELYDLESDYEELHDLYPAGPAIARALREELLEKLNSENSRYLKQ